MANFKISDLPQRIQDKISIHPESGCWEWTAALSTKRENEGYGIISWNGNPRLAHIIIYNLLVGEIPLGLECDHLCRNRKCSNPKHIEPVTHLINVRRGDGGKFWRDKIYCPEGHAYDDDNTHINATSGGRICKICANIHKTKHRRKIGIKIRKFKHEITHCPAGHEYTPENTYGNHQCKICKKECERRYNAKKMDLKKCTLFRIER